MLDSMSTMSDKAGPQLDIQSTITTDLSTVDQASSHFTHPTYSSWNLPTCRYAEHLYAENTAPPLEV